MPALRPARSRTTFALAGAVVDLFGEAEDKPPTEFRIFERGVVHSVKGDFLFDDEAVASVMEAYQQHGVELTVDYDHHTLATQDGVQAISAGWFGLEMRDDGLYAVNVRWTDKALAHLQAREYRYFSPLFKAHPKTGRIEKLLNNALTNTPALHRIDALMAASAHTHTEEDTVDPELKKALDRIAELEKQGVAKDATIRSLEGQNQNAALSTVVGLSANAGPEEIRTRVVALATFGRQALAIAGKATEAEAIGVLSAMKEQAAESVVLREQVQAAEITALQTEFDSVMGEASKAGKIPPAKTHARHVFALSISGAAAGKLTKEGVVSLRSYVGTLEPLVTDGSEARQPGGTVALSAMELEIARRTGTSVEAITKHKEKRLAGS